MYYTIYGKEWDKPNQERYTTLWDRAQNKGLEKSGRVLKRLFFIRYRYQGDSVEEAAQKVSVTKKLGYIWQDRWNTHGFPGLIPRFGGGRPPLLDEEQRNDLITSLKARDDWTTKEIRDLIKERYGIEYTMKHVRELLHGIWAWNLENHILMISGDPGMLRNG